MQSSPELHNEVITRGIGKLRDVAVFSRVQTTQEDLPHWKALGDQPVHRLEGELLQTRDEVVVGLLFYEVLALFELLVLQKLLYLQAGHLVSRQGPRWHWRAGRDGFRPKRLLYQ